MTKTSIVLLSLILTASITTTALAYPQTVRSENSAAAAPVAQTAPAAGTTNTMDALNRPADASPTIATPPQPAAPVSPVPQENDYPVRLIVPSIKLDTSIVGVGVNDKGEMDVPSGATDNVGWYDQGTVPGNLGSAVLDAHVFAAFQNLANLKNGADIYVVMHSGKQLHFVASEETYYPLADVPLQKLFNRADEPRLNLITCAGKLTPDHSTYDHRLIVYSTLTQ